ncbi:hypothetical protein DFH09DRAFT_1414205, partial [Mycena vulgaris]
LDRLAIPGDYDSDQDQEEPSKTGKPVRRRRRRSKACDQYRKSKCKCGRGTGDACRCCVLLGTECTFLGPSRKRGPPKGCIDARLHQTEALVAILLAAAGRGEGRAGGVLRDLGEVRQLPFSGVMLTRPRTPSPAPSSHASTAARTAPQAPAPPRLPPRPRVTTGQRWLSARRGAINGRPAGMDVGSTRCVVLLIRFLPSFLGSRSVLPPSSPRAVRRWRAARAMAATSPSLTRPRTPSVHIVVTPPHSTSACPARGGARVSPSRVRCVCALAPEVRSRRAPPSPCSLPRCLRTAPAAYRSLPPAPHALELLLLLLRKTLTPAGCIPFRIHLHPRTSSHTYMYYLPVPMPIHCFPIHAFRAPSRVD